MSTWLDPLNYAVRSVGFPLCASIRKGECILWYTFGEGDIYMYSRKWRVFSLALAGGPDPVQ